MNSPNERGIMLRTRDLVALVVFFIAVAVMVGAIYTVINVACH